MARIKFDIDTQSGGHDTESGGHTLFDKLRFTARKKLGILSSITLIPSDGAFTSLVSDIETGYGGNPGTSAKREKVSKANLKSKRGELLDPHGDDCKVIATVGGLFVNTEISDNANTVPYVCLVGSIPEAVDSTCCGGVSLESWKSNVLRVKLLIDPQHNLTDNDICLYRDDGTHSQGAVAVTGVPKDEIDNWTNAAPNGLGLTKVKDCSGVFENDLNGTGAGQGLPTGTKGLVISASPFFLNNRNDLVTAANKWLTGTPANTTRYVVYPLQIYNEGAAPTITNFSNAGTSSSGKNILFGPDLRKACRLLGYLASLAIDYETGWFQTVPNIKLEV